MGSSPWEEIFRRYRIDQHDFDRSPFELSAAEIKSATQGFAKTGEREVRILCKQDSRESRPRVFQERGLFLLPVKNGKYVIVKGEGYVDIPAIDSPPRHYQSAFPFELETARIGNSEMQNLDRAYNYSVIRNFLDDESLVLTIRGRKYTPEFRFRVGKFEITAASVQTEVDGGYEGQNQVALIEAKGSGAGNTIIRQLYYPFRQWKEHTNKPISTLFFQRTNTNEFHIWRFGFEDVNDYNSIRLIDSARYIIEHKR